MSMPPQQPTGHSGLTPATTTSWTVAGRTINVQVNASPAEGFIAKGVRYQPTPLGVAGDQAGRPLGDFFYSGADFVDQKTLLFWEPIWTRDLNLMRAAGINMLGVYGTYNVPPVTLSNGGSGSVVIEPNEMSSINWDALGPIRYDSVYPTYLPTNAGSKQPPPYWYHFGHDRFLDLCWNGGTNPIYVWLGVNVPNFAFFASNPAPGMPYTNQQAFYLASAKWLATSYADHPALAGFIITNETNTSDTNDKLEYWDFLNQIHGALKTAAPAKLTMAGFQDNPDTLTAELVAYAQTPVPGGSPPSTVPVWVDASGKPTTTKPPTNPVRATARDAYQLDIWGWNLYGQAKPSTDIIQFASSILGTPHEKPIILAEIGVPNALRYADSSGNAKYRPVPNGYYSKWENGTATLEPYDASQANLGIELPAIQDTTSTDRTSFPGSHPVYDGGGLILYETDTQDYYLYAYSTGQSSPQWVQLTNPHYKPLLDFAREHSIAGAAAGIALYGYFLAAGSYTGSSSGPSNALSGVMAFEWVDEWFKWVDAGLDPAAIQKASEVHDFRESAIQPWGPADAQYYTVWDEEWFGLCSALSTGRSSTDPAIASTGWLNGGADGLTPRLAYYAAQLYFTGTLVPPAST